MRSPKSPYRQRREVARLEYLYGPPVDPMELFNLATPAEIFNLDSDPSRATLGAAWTVWCILPACRPSS